MSSENVKYNTRERHRCGARQRVHAFITCYYLDEWSRKRREFGRLDDYNRALNRGSHLVDN
jgi:hypothetical protein